MAEHNPGPPPPPPPDWNIGVDLSGGIPWLGIAILIIVLIVIAVGIWQGWR